MASIDQYRIPSLRARYVARARFLKTNPPFRASIDQIRAAWDNDFPMFSIGEPSIPPAKSPVSPPFQPAPPARLLTALWEQNKQIGNAVRDNERANLVHTALGHWNQGLGNLCFEWWPPRYYPVLSRWEDHPARRFVASCLTYKMEWVQEEWISSQILDAIPLMGAPGDVYSSSESPDAARGRAQFNFALQRLWDLASEGTPITTAMIDQVTREAFEKGDAAWHDRQQDIFSRAPGKGAFTGSFLYFPVFPRMTHDDWDQAKPWVLSSMRDTYGENPLADDARQLHAEGASVRAIAGLLGISRPTVSAWLRQKP